MRDACVKNPSSCLLYRTLHTHACKGDLLLPEISSEEQRSIPILYSENLRPVPVLVCASNIDIYVDLHQAIYLCALRTSRTHTYEGKSHEAF